MNLFCSALVFPYLCPLYAVSKKGQNGQNILKIGDFALFFMKNNSFLRRIHDRIYYSYKAFIGI